MNASSELADIIRFHRKKQGLTQLGLAELADVGKTVIFDIESGKETVQVDTLSKVLSALGIRIKLESPLMQEFARSRMELES
ncbi:MAG: helix-turn-helix domain-containing protein [Bacteroidota bacterium]